MADLAGNRSSPDAARSKPTRATPVSARARPANAEGAQTRASGSELVTRPAAKDTDKASALSPSFATAETDTRSAEDHYAYLSIGPLKRIWRG